METRQQLEAIVTEMIATGEKINVSRVAAKAGVSNALIYNRYPELKVRIQTAKETQQSRKQQVEATTEAEKLKSQLDKAKKTQEEAELMACSYQKQNEQLWEHIQQVYAMYDQVLVERNDFAERLKFMK
ncbi:hypothetical protein P4S52_12270 [Vibrio sp. SA48]|uniref:TetR family transcriptional regulator n=2 Tax=Unclassified Bacteria TaxID=49928 RepID=A0AAU6UU86_UNCXX|nr:hypothetical protein [Vibrio sp. S12_S33]EKO3618146.1 hypothetical protein [Vibrio metschnikovii]EKO3769847.1 hypothetical protein [Vibrio metschnikovii]MBD1566040.1 hypothetical protein [Vibrio sp. S12_S33]